MSARIVVAGTSSRAGKTSIACGLMGALRARGLSVQGFKVGPDYIDPSYHTVACGRPGRNLDAFISGPELIAPLFRHVSHSADIAVIEGVMGLFDGASGQGELASTAHIAKLLDAPVLLVVDASGMGRSAAAIVQGYRSFDPDVELAGVILNRIGSDHHEQLLREAIEPLGVPVLGALRRDSSVVTPERHLGLVPVDEREPQARATLERLAALVSESVDLDAVVALAQAARPIAGPTWSPECAEPVGEIRVALAAGPAFSFHYQENLELLLAAGAELVPFDPLKDERLPEGADALLLAGGFPEVFGAELASNSSLRAEIAAFAGSGRPIVAECGGLLYLSRELDGQEMCGVVPGRAHMTKRLTLGYREATALTSTPCVAAGDRLRGHEFHYSELETESSSPAWVMSVRGAERREGFASASLHASYLHLHWASSPQVAHRLLTTAARSRAVAVA